MPVYEYQCEACGQTFEEMQKFSDAPLRDCTRCGKTGTLKKLMSLTSFALKGTGWYTTDYKRAGGKSGSSNDSSGGGSSGGSSSGDSSSGKS